MLDWLFSTEGFIPRKSCGTWTPEMIGLHVGSDLLIWLAYLTISLVLAYHALRYGLGHYSKLAWLFAAFILCSGFTRFFDAVMFETPVYHLSGVTKAATVVVSWATVIALIPAAPRLFAALGRPNETSLTMPSLAALQATQVPIKTLGTLQRYLVAVLAAVLAVLVRGIFHPLLGGDHAFVIPLAAVVFVSWYSGFGPGLLTLFASMTGVVVFFLDTNSYYLLTKLNDQLSTGMFIFAGIGCAMLGEAQRHYRARAKRNLLLTQDRQRDLESLTEQLATSQRQTAETLAQLDTFVMNAPLGLAFLDPQLRFVRVNKHLADANEKDIVEYLGKPLAEVVPDLPADAMADYRRVMETGEPLVDQLVFGPVGERTPNDRVWQSSYYPVRGPGGTLLGVGLVTKEISEQIRAEQALRDSEARFRTLAEAMPQIVWVTNPDGFTDYFNPRWYEHTGRTIAESLGSEWIHVLHPEDRARAEAHWRYCTQTASFYEIEYRFRGADGAYRWYLGRGLPQRDESGTIIRWIGTCTDIEDAKRLQAMTVLSLERFRALAESIPSMVFTATPAGAIDYFNQRWFQYTGFTDVPVEFARNDAVHPDDRATLTALWDKALAEGTPYESEHRVRRHDQSYRWHLSRSLPVRALDGTITQWVGTVTDIEVQRRYREALELQVRERTTELSAVVAMLRTEVDVRRRAEQAAQVATEELQRSNGELEQFAYVASHDLQEPLRKIQAFGSRLQTNYGPQIGEVGTDYLSRMLNAAGRMRQLIDDLLAFSRVTSKGQPFGSVDLQDVIEGVLADLEIRILQTNATVEVGDLPTIDADPLQMRQLFQNLIGNALKFQTPGVPPVVRVSAKLVAGENPQCELSFADNGIGFDTKYLDRIFQVFQRLHGRGEYEGTGVGLAICRKIVERHGGTITATSTPTEGATFIVVLPVHQSLSTAVLANA